MAKWRAQCPSPLIKVLPRRIWTQFVHKVAPVFFFFSLRAQAVIFRLPRISGFLGDKSGMINKQSYLRMAPLERCHARREALNVCFFVAVPAHSWCSKEGLAALKLFSPPPPCIPAALSLPSITPDCIWQMPLLALYHQVWWSSLRLYYSAHIPWLRPLPPFFPSSSGTIFIADILAAAVLEKLGKCWLQTSGFRSPALIAVLA